MKKRILSMLLSITLMFSIASTMSVSLAVSADVVVTDGNGQSYSVSETGLTQYIPLPEDLLGYGTVQCGEIYYLTLPANVDDITVDFSKYSAVNDICTTQIVNDQMKASYSFSFSSLYNAKNEGWAMTGEAAKSGVTLSGVFGNTLPADLESTNQVITLVGVDYNNNIWNGNAEVVLIIQKVVEDQVNTENLKNAINTADAATSDKYYTSNDRYNGNGTYTISPAITPYSLYAKMQSALTVAKALFTDNDQSKELKNGKSQSEVDAATDALNNTLAGLISKTNHNTTALYEAVQSAKTLDESLYTAVSWVAMGSAVFYAETLLKSLYYQQGDIIPEGKSPGSPTDINASSNDTTTDALIAAESNLAVAAQGLYLASRYDAAEAKIKKVQTYLPTLFELIDASGLKESEYTSGSWATFQSILMAAKEAEAPALTGLAADTDAANAYVKIYDDLYQAFYWELVPTGEITVNLRSLDPSYARYVNNPMDYKGYYTIASSGIGYTGNVTLSGGYTLGDALTAAGIAIGNNVPGVYINGVYVSDDYVGFSNYAALESLVLHPGDTVTVDWNTMPLSKQSPTINYNPASLYQYEDSLKISRFQEQDGLAVEAGKEFTLTAEEAAAAFAAYIGVYTPADNMTLYISAVSDSGTGNQPLTMKLQADGKDITTDSNGQARIILFEEGWYIIAAYDLESDTPGDQPDYGDTTVTKGIYPSVNSGAVIRVHVTSASDPASVKAKLKAALNDVYQTYAESYFRAADWESLVSAFNTAASGIEGAGTIAAAYSAQQTGIVAIKKIQDNMLGDNTTRLAAFRDRLDRLPDSVNQLTQSEQSLVTSLIACFTALSDYQKGQLTNAELNQYDQIVNANSSGLPAAVSYGLKVEIKADSDTAAASLTEMIAYLQAHNTNKANPNSQDIAALSGNTDLWKLNQFYTYERSDVGSTSKEALNAVAAYPDNKINLAYDCGFYAYGLVRDAPGKILSGNGWTISDENFTLSDYLSSKTSYDYYGVLTNMTVKLGGSAYEIKSITFSGIDGNDVTYGRSELIDRTTYKGKSENNVNVWFEDAVLSFIMPYNDVTITYKWGPVTSDTELQAEKNAAKSVIETAYASYDLTKYDDTGKAALLKANEDGIAAVEAAATADGVTAARRTALAAMASVAKISGGTGESPVTLPDFGAVVGMIYINVENMTFPGGDFTGPLLSGWYDLCENDTMMTAILKALALNGYGWTGSGGTNGNVNDYTISYLASVTKDAKSLGEFSGESGSGWMGTLNDWFVNEGFNQSTSAGWHLENGDMINIVYTQNQGADVGGVWNSADTSLKALSISAGTLMPNFSSGKTTYGLIIPSGSQSLTVTPIASNKNYLIKTFLNTYNSDAAYYKRSETISVKPGDSIFIGCGDYAWPSMNRQSDDAISYTGTRYTIKVYNSMASYVTDLIAALPNATQITMSTYTGYESAVANARSVYNGLTSSEQSTVTNLSALTAAEAKMTFYLQLDNVKTLLMAIPNVSTITKSNMQTIAAQVLTAKKSYDALSTDQQLYITVSVVANYNAAIKTLTELGAFDASSAPSTIIGSDKAPENTDGTVTLNPSATASNGKAIVTVVASALADAINTAKDNSGTTIVIAPEINGMAKTVSVALPKSSLSSMASDTDAVLTVQTPVGNMTLPNNVLDAIASQALESGVTMSLEAVDTATLTADQQKAVGDSLVFGISIMSGSKSISSFGGGSISISLPYTLGDGETADGVVIWYLNDAGALEQMTCVYDMMASLATFTTTHLSYYLVGYDEWTNPFVDVKSTDWFYSAVKYATQKSLMSGTSTTGFEPNANMTRAMLVTVLYRLEGKPSVTDTNGFTDVADGQWYTDAVVWASVNNIMSGYGGGLFGTNDSVTREQLATILMNYAIYKKYDVAKMVELTAFTDASGASTWASAAIKWAVAEGLITGTTSSALSPGGNASRAQVAMTLMRFAENITK